MAKTKEKEAVVVRPGDLAKDLNVPAKRIRAFLRSEFPRTNEEKNSSWVLTDKQVTAVINRFSKEEDE